MMDLMYGYCGPELEFDNELSIQEMIENDLKTESEDSYRNKVEGRGLKRTSSFLSPSYGTDIDEILSSWNTSVNEDLTDGALLHNSGFEEFGMHFFESKLANSLEHYLTGDGGSSSDKDNSLGGGVSVTSSNSLSSRNNSLSSGGSSTMGVKKGTTSNLNFSVGGSGGPLHSTINGSAVVINQRNPRKSMTVRNVSSYSNNSLKASAVAPTTISLSSWNSVSINRSEVSNGISFEESCGIMVDPSSIVPASISGSTGSSSIGSETDPECLATDDESDGDLISGSISAWIVPPATESRSPSPVLEEVEVEEPEFIFSTGSQAVEPPPAKKRKQKHDPQPHTDGKIYPKPALSYSSLITMSLRNSKTGCLPVSEIYKFMCDHFPFFKTAPSGWKNSVRHNLSLNKSFEKIEKPGNGARKGCLWALNPTKVNKMDEEVQKSSNKDINAILRAMSDPENLGAIQRGEMKKDYSGNGSEEDDEDEYTDPATPSTPAQLLARRASTNRTDSALGNGQVAIASPIITTVSQVHAAMHRPADQKIHIRKEDPLEFGTITNVQGNYNFCQTPGAQTYTLSFSPLNNTTPIIIRRTPVK